MKKEQIQAIEQVLDRRQQRGATDENLILWLEATQNKEQIKYERNRITLDSLNHSLGVLDGFIDAIKQTPLP